MVRCPPRRLSTLRRDPQQLHHVPVLTLMLGSRTVIWTTQEDGRPNPGGPSDLCLWNHPGRRVQGGGGQALCPCLRPLPGSSGLLCSPALGAEHAAPAAHVWEGPSP